MVYGHLPISDKVDRSEHAESEVVVKIETVPQAQAFYHPSKRDGDTASRWVEERRQC